jgi:nucleolar protein 58
MLVLFETPGGYSLFQVLDEGKLKNVEDIQKCFETEGKASALLKLKAFEPFADTAEAVACATALIENKLDKGLQKFLKKNIVSKKLTDELAVYDSKIGGIIKDKLGIQCLANSKIMELMRGIRSQMNSLIDTIEEADMKAMALGLSHSLSRYKLKFSPDKVDTMIVQAIGLLDDLDKEINTYAMRVREWYGWHFPEMGKVVEGNVAYSKAVIKMGYRSNCSKTDFGDILTEDVSDILHSVAEVSMGTEISEEDMMNIKCLCEQIISMTEYRLQLFEYLKKRMAAIAPNLTTMVGEMVGARLIAHAGSLMNLAKHPASTVQILGAEKALFRALKTRHETPKYGLIYHASLIGQTSTKFKGKISRVLAAKTALAIRVDAMGEGGNESFGLDNRAKVEARMRQLEGGGQLQVLSSTPKKSTPAKYGKDASSGAAAYNAAADDVSAKTEKKSKKRKASTDSSDAKEVEAEDTSKAGDSETPKKKKKKKKSVSSEEAPKAEAPKAEALTEKSPKKKKKKSVSSA